MHDDSNGGEESLKDKLLKKPELPNRPDLADDPKADRWSRQVLGLARLHAQDVQQELGLPPKKDSPSRE